MIWTYSQAKDHMKWILLLLCYELLCDLKQTPNFSGALLPSLTLEVIGLDTPQVSSITRISQVFVVLPQSGGDFCGDFSGTTKITTTTIDV